MSVVAFAYRIQARPRGGFYVFADHSRFGAQRAFAGLLRDRLRACGLTAESCVVGRGKGSRYVESVAVIAPAATPADLPTIARTAGEIIRAEACAA